MSQIPWAVKRDTDNGRTASSGRGTFTATGGYPGFVHWAVRKRSDGVVVSVILRRRVL